MDTRTIKPAMTIGTFKDQSTQLHKVSFLVFTPKFTPSEGIKCCHIIAWLFYVGIFQIFSSLQMQLQWAVSQ